MVFPRPWQLLLSRVPLRARSSFPFEVVPRAMTQEKRSSVWAWFCWAASWGSIIPNSERRQAVVRRHVVYFALTAVLSSCASLPTIVTFYDPPATPSAIKEPVVAKALALRKTGYLDFIPLPRNYPVGYSPHQRVFTGEVFSRNPESGLPSPGLRFVPKDYLLILESAFSQALYGSGVNPTRYTSLQEARASGCDLLIVGAAQEFYVEDESKAVVKVFYTLYSPSQQRTIWQRSIESEFVHTGLPRSVTGKSLVFLVGSHEFNFQPQRALLAVATYNNTVELLTEFVRATRETW